MSIVPYTTKPPCCGTISRFVSNQVTKPPQKVFSKLDEVTSGWVSNPLVPDRHRKTKKAVMGLFNPVEELNVQFPHLEGNLRARVHRYKSVENRGEIRHLVFVTGGTITLEVTLPFLYPYFKAISKSTEPLNVCITCITLYGLEYQAKVDGPFEHYRPERFCELASILRNILMSRRLAEEQKFHALVLHSMGGALLSGLKEGDLTFMTQALVLSSTVTSIRKVAERTLGCCIRKLLLTLAGCGYEARSPEDDLIAHAKANLLTGLHVLFSAIVEDYYWGGAAAYKKELPAALRKSGATCDQYEWHIPKRDRHERATHDAQANFLVTQMTPHMKRLAATGLDEELPTEEAEGKAEPRRWEQRGVENLAELIVRNALGVELRPPGKEEAVDPSDVKVEE